MEAGAGLGWAGLGWAGEGLGWAGLGLGLVKARLKLGLGLCRHDVWSAPGRDVTMSREALCGPQFLCNKRNLQL